MNNWHIKIADCNEAQKERLKRVHGNGVVNFSFLAVSENLIHPVPTLFVKSELITPDEAFERLGLDVKPTEMGVKRYKESIARLEHAIGCRKEDLFNAEKKIKELECQKNALQQSNALIEDELGHAEQINYKLEQQLTAKSELQGVDWSIIEPEYNWLAQNKGSGTIDFHYVKPTGSKYAILATRPKPKYTPEQIEAVKDFDAWVSRRHKLSGEFNWWLKEVGNDG